MNKQEVIDYLMYTPYNTNLAVLKSMLGDGNWDELLDYVKRTSYRINRRVLEGILGADDYIVLVDGTYTFEEDGDYGLYAVPLDKYYEPTNVIVTVDGITVTLPRAEMTGNWYGYGEFGENDIPMFTTYLAAVVLVNYSEGVVVNVAVPIAGEHTVKVMVSNDSEIDDDDTSEGAIVGEAVVGSAIVMENLDIQPDSGTIGGNR